MASNVFVVIAESWDTKAFILSSSVSHSSKMVQAVYLQILREKATFESTPILGLSNYTPTPTPHPPRDNDQAFQV